MEKTVDVTIPPELRKKLEAAKAVPPSRPIWEEWERRVVQEYGPKFGARGLMPYLPGRTEAAIGQMMQRLGVKHTGVKK